MGEPSRIVLICNVTGRSAVDLFLKKISHLVTNTPLSSVTSNDCARGSTYTVFCVVEKLDVMLDTNLTSVVDDDRGTSVCAILDISAFLILYVTSSTLYKVPLEEKLD